MVVFASLVAGLVLWTALEYVLHRFAMHNRPGRDPIAREHLLHHADPAATSLALRTLGHLGVAGVAAAAGWGLSYLVGPQVAAGGAGGVALGYSSYELLHWIAHHRAPRTAYGRRLRRRHFQHHFGRPRANFGVTNAVWDRAFGTADPLGPVRVPRRLAMSWLLDAAGTVRPDYRADYRVAGSGDNDAAAAERDRERAFADLAPLD